MARQINHHQEWGQRVIWPTLAMWLLAVVLVLMDRRGGRRQGTALTVVAVLAALAAVAAAAAVVITGHLGSTAVWSCTVGSDACK